MFVAASRYNKTGSKIATSNNCNFYVIYHFTTNSVYRIFWGIPDCRNKMAGSLRAAVTAPVGPELALVGVGGAKLPETARF